MVDSIGCVCKGDVLVPIMYSFPTLRIGFLEHTVDVE